MHSRGAEPRRSDSNDTVHDLVLRRQCVRPLSSSVIMVVQVTDKCYQYLPLSLANPRIHCCSFLRDLREIEPSCTLDAERELPEMGLRFKRGQDHSVVARFAVLFSFQDVEQGILGTYVPCLSQPSPDHTYMPQRKSPLPSLLTYSNVSIQRRNANERAPVRTRRFARRKTRQRSRSAALL